MKTISKLILLVLFNFIGCTHIINPNNDINEYYSKIELLSIKREATIYLLNESPTLELIYLGKSICFYKDSIKFYSIQKFKNITLPIKIIERIEICSGNDGGGEGMLPGILFGFAAGNLIFHLNHKHTSNYDNYYPPAAKIPYLAVSIPIGMFFGYIIGRNKGNYVFIIN